MTKENLSRILDEINAASEKSGFNEKVELIAVTKLHTVEEISPLYEFGLRNFGENRVQEFNSKYESLPDDVNWHIIGSLQKNKLKYIIGKVKLIQSVDSVDLAQAINDFSMKKNIVTDILIETNVSGEESKHGFTPNVLSEVTEQISKMNNIRLNGMMMMAPDTDDEILLSSLFEKTRNIFEDIMETTSKYDNIKFEVLSMGMSQDYKLAIKAGSNMVRLGRILFS